ncbi:Spo0E family sporulation regulatory protein-aspartic acid phosphatase [Domibacillus aminovorans]|uniref:Spo0E family sporulation regulatory protein-aspartic acid phosphatase n=1 Tax=Domibacillus aminovorans TaxID=29332 RepID=UPI0012FD6F61|nr:Spo0E family sporulation regulatory protein-aspartic acid phosphatase [Domibacillus aminovorans]
MGNRQHLLEAIVKEAVKLTLLVKSNGLNSNQTIMQSKKLDDLILTYQQQERGR